MKTTEVIAVAYNRGLRPRIASDLIGGQRVEWDGGKVDATLRRVLDHPAHRDEILKLVASGYTPEAKHQSDAQARTPTDGRPVGMTREYFEDGTDYYPDRTAPLAGVPEFDHEAEAAVRSLYAVGVGIVPKIRLCVKSNEPSITWECLVGCGYDRDAAVGQIARVRPIRDRVIAHLSPLYTGEWGGKNYDEFDRYGGHFDLEFRDRGHPDGHHLSRWRQLYPARDTRHPFCIKPCTRFTAWRWYGETHWRALWGEFVTDEDGRKVVFRPYGV